MNRSKWIVTTLFALSMAGPAAADPGSMLGNTCAGCHGLNGASAGETMPIIAGMPRDFIFNAMKEFRDGSRGSTIMGRIAKGYNDTQLGAMADFFSRQKWVSAPHKAADAAALKRGEKLHVKQCEACHRDNGVSQTLDMPRLAGQWPGYIKIYMDTCNARKFNFRHPHAMTDLCGDLDAADTAALLYFYASQK